VVNVANKNCTSAVIQKRFDPVADMSRPIAAGIFIQRYATRRAIGEPKPMDASRLSISFTN
jgi:hypothetical protein